MNPEEFVDHILEDSPFAWRSLLEVGLSRALDHFEHQEFAQISADRREMPEDEKANARRELERDLVGYDLGYISMRGRGQEEVGGKVMPTEEISYFVPNRTRKGVKIPDFREIMLSLAAKFNQYAIIYGPGDGSADLLLSNGSVDKHWTQWHPSKADFFTSLKQGSRNFHYESVQRVYPGNSKVGWFEGLAAYSRGEITNYWSWPLEPVPPIPPENLPTKHTISTAPAYRDSL